MKKIMILFSLLLLLAGCSAEAAPSMYIQPAQLDEREEAVARLLGTRTNTSSTWCWTARPGG